MSREMDHFALQPHASHHINFCKTSPHLCSFPFYRALQIEEKGENEKEAGSQPLLCAPLGGIWHSCLLSQTLLDRGTKDGERKAGKFSELANVLFNFFALLPCFSLFLLLVFAGSHDSFLFSRAEVLDGRGGRDGAARHLVLLSPFTRSCFCRLDTRIACNVNLFRFLNSNDHLKNSSFGVHSLCGATCLIGILSSSAV
ncbi:hypothetical protein TRIATDRAFT_301013 [Trichoderma atroviride IMI 206040]|uniref:Transmembrane protein n=1 Tax=Hypocrea atroviridis (strain ATCC 20476 / IMI 206040) TaxID=452589 RepID=G9P3U1_HYPAI|nr:uncharacterized protein TRIATDRAFT_301013 [Trichoderma atroviride IMI 206040]EHK43046.1 hypothetical protein TRIATDRAFT_301013 [Trichoderma atroviride IMI 206040]